MKDRGWGKTKTTVGYAAHLRTLTPEEAYEQIAAFCVNRQRAKDPPTVQEVMTALGLTAAEVRQAAVAPVVVEGMQFDLTMIDTPTVAVGLDDHQNKHQTQRMPELKAYTGGAGGRGVAAKYPTNSDAAWHRITTAPIVSAWVSALDAAGRLDPPGTTVMSATGEELERHAGHLFVASALKDSAGKLYASYHCYPG